MAWRIGRAGVCESYISNIVAARICSCRVAICARYVAMCMCFDAEVITVMCYVYQ